MKDFLSKTLGGLTREYYFRQFLFGVILSVAFFYMITQGDFSKLEIRDMLIIIVNTFLYPYSRYVYEGIVNFIRGDNNNGSIWLADMYWAFMIRYILFLFKLMMMFFCWVLAVFIAPVGLLFLYLMNSKK